MPPKSWEDLESELSTLWGRAAVGPETLWSVLGDRTGQDSIDRVWSPGGRGESCGTSELSTSERTCSSGYGDSKSTRGQSGAAPMSQQDPDRSHRSQQRCPSMLSQLSAIPMTLTVQCLQLPAVMHPPVPEEKGQCVCRKRERRACRDTLSRQTGGWEEP